ncbi:MAG: nitrogenase stabilizing/protective protein NifW [Rhodocyclaceae bacterium]
MNEFTRRLAKLSSAEEFLQFFSLAYDQHVVNVARLHILKRFYQYLRQDTGLTDHTDESTLYARYRALLSRAYDDFLRSTPAQEKVFKVFQTAQGQHSATLDSLLDTLPSRTVRRGH